MNNAPSLALRCATGMFWCWNVIFICSTLPMIPALPLLCTEWLRGDVPFDYAFMLLAWLAIPWACVVLARMRLRGRPEALAFLFFAAEGPFFSLCLYRLIILRELTPAVSQWLLMLAFGVSVQGWHVLIRPLPDTQRWQTLRLLATTCLALAAVYFGALVLLAWSPWALRAAWEVINPANWWHLSTIPKKDLLLLVLIPVAGVFILFVAASLLAIPLCMTVAYLRAFVQTVRVGPLPVARRVWAVSAMLALQGLVFADVNHQPQKEAFRLLESPELTPALFNENKESLRAGLLNAYLAPYRYASSTVESTGVAASYRQLLGLEPTLAAWPQGAFNALARPLLYDGDRMEQDAVRAARLYEQYFDARIQRGERPAIARALSATYSDDEREAGLVNIDQRKVRVAEQGVRIEAQGDLAQVTLDETYVNLTDTQQEIFYLFSLPESAAITGLWLGTSLDDMQPFTVAPRGAAQRVYKAEVRRRIDPALLEQVGPRQYRLRAFPVPPRVQARDADSQPVAKLHLRLRYTAFARHGAWPLPVLAEKRNVAWDRLTRRTCNGGPCPGDLSTWWPRELPLGQPAVRSHHAWTLGDGRRTIVAEPVDAEAPGVAGRKITLVLDRSTSMAAHREELLATLRQARRELAGNEVSVVLTTTPAMKQEPRRVALADLSDAAATEFMGGGTVDQMLQQALKTGTEPQDLVVLVTDDGAFDLQTDASRARLAGGMLSLVHLGGVMAPAYDDATLESVQATGGSAFATLAEAWQHFARTQASPPGFLMERDGYAYSVREGAATIAADAAFAPLAARLFIAAATRRSRPLDVAQLDELHALAQKHGVVTPYSSMLVLVNAEQQKALARAEAEADRFDRSAEPGVEILQKPKNVLTASATPEPEEWLLLIVSAGVAAWMFRAHRRTRRGAAGYGTPFPRNRLPMSCVFSNVASSPTNRPAGLMLPLPPSSTVY